ncbi:hypothetical protein KAU45_02815 [bacterium]|nr:hypothetical protein [bacterium]
MTIKEIAQIILRKFYERAEVIGYGKKPILPFDAIKEVTGATDDSKIIKACEYLHEEGFLVFELHKLVGNSIVPFAYHEDGPKAIIAGITKDGAMYIEEHCLDKDKKMTIVNLAFEILQILYDHHLGETQLPDNHLSDKEITQKTGETNKKRMLAATRHLENKNYIKIHPRNFLDTYESHMQRFPEPPYFNFEGIITENGMMAVEHGNFINEAQIHVDSSRHTITIGNGNIVQSPIGDITIINQEVTEMCREIEKTLHNDNTLTQEEIKDALNDLKSLMHQLEKTKKDKNVIERLLANLGSVASIASLVFTLSTYLT